jgi:hypothetical protein
MATKLSTLLNEASALKLLAEQLKRLEGLHQVYSDAVPGSLLETSRVGYLDGNTLIIIAFSGTTAAGLRQRLPTIEAKIQQRRPEITGLRVVVQLEKSQPATSETRPKRVLSASAVRHVESCASDLEASPLKQALTKLVARAKSDEYQPLDDVEQRNRGEQHDKKSE